MYPFFNWFITMFPPKMATKMGRISNDPTNENAKSKLPRMPCHLPVALSKVLKVTTSGSNACHRMQLFIDTAVSQCPRSDSGESSTWVWRLGWMFIPTWVDWVNTTNRRNVGKTIINHPFGNVLNHLFVAIWGMVYHCFTHILDKTRKDEHRFKKKT